MKKIGETKRSDLLNAAEKKQHVKNQHKLKQADLLFVNSLCGHYRRF